MYARRAPSVPLKRGTEKGAMETSEINSSFLILVENYPINHHVVTCSDIVNSDGDTHSNSRAYHILIEDFAAPRHVSDRFAEMVSPRPAAFLENDCPAWSVFRDRAAAFCGSRRCGCL